MGIMLYIPLQGVQSNIPINCFNMDDFNQINQIVSDAIKDSSYITVLISSGIYILYNLIIKLVDLFKAKDRNKPLIQMASTIKEVSENVVKLNTVLDKQIQDAESKELTKVRQVISLAFLCKISRTDCSSTEIKQASSEAAKDPKHLICASGLSVLYCDSRFSGSAPYSFQNQFCILPRINSVFFRESILYFFQNQLHIPDSAFFPESVL